MSKAIEASKIDNQKNILKNKHLREWYESYHACERAFLLIAVLVMAGTLCACERQSTGVMKTTGGKEQTVSEKDIPGVIHR